MDAPRLKRAAASAPRAPDQSSLPAEAAAAVHAVFDSYHAQFKLVTRRARARFETRDWRGAQLDAVERLTLYRQFVEWTVRELHRLLGGALSDRALWGETKQIYARLVGDRNDVELAYTFFNSISRRVLATIGVDPAVEYAEADFGCRPRESAGPILRTYGAAGSTQDLCLQVLRDLPFVTLMRDPVQDAMLVAQQLNLHLNTLPGAPGLEAVEVIPDLFYRNKGAYLVGRLRAGAELVPLVLPLVHTDRGVEVDAVLTISADIGIVFSFTRSYFHVEVDRPLGVIDFLRTLMPLKPVDELYTSIGYNKHGKTELFLSLQRHLAGPEARFEVAEGDRGLVMSVFALPSLNVVFKVIKDRFGAPKNTTRRAVMEKYQLVFVRDRVGRLADAQEFEHLEFSRDQFAPELLEELLAQAADTVRIVEDRVVVGHVYTERRVTPLNIYLRRADPEAARDAVLDYGQAIKDLAIANIFTGDMLLKNFGVTRQGRVIFYDYDELCLLTECHFRRIPPPRGEEDELSAEPWFYVGERDVFPEEFKVFLLLPGDLGTVFLSAHRDLLDVEFWLRMQDLQSAGEVVDFFPYRQSLRLRPERAE